MPNMKTNGIKNLPKTNRNSNDAQVRGESITGKKRANGEKKSHPPKNHVPGYGSILGVGAVDALWLDRFQMDIIDLDRAGLGAGQFWASSCSPASLGPLMAVAAADSRDCSASRIPSRISAVEAPCGAVVVRVSVARIRSSEAACSLSFSISASVTRRSFSRRTSRPRLWQYHKTKSKTMRNRVLVGFHYRGRHRFSNTYWLRPMTTGHSCLRRRGTEPSKRPRWTAAFPQ